MKKRTIYCFIFLVTLTVLTACSDFLDLAPRHEVTGETAINNLEKARAAVNGVYATFQNDNWAGGLYVALNTKAGFTRFTGSADYTFGYSQNSGGKDAIWSAFYTSLNAANYAITGIEALATDRFPSEADKTRLIAEARALRAWINANLLWNFAHWWAGDEDNYGILYRDQPSELNNVQQSRLTVGESYAKIYEDLDYAIEHLGSFFSPRFVSKEFAKVLKAKLLLYRGGYQNNAADLQFSLALVDDVMNNRPSGWALEADIEAMYQNSWDSKENMFVRYLENDGSRTSRGGYWYTYGMIIYGNTLPLPVGGTLSAGLNYGLDWFLADPRWSIATGEVRHPETWAEYNMYTFKKLTRLGSYQGRQVSPPDEEYAAYYFRLAELYLMQSELRARTGASVAESIAPINTLRATRTNPVFSQLNPGSQDELMDLIFKEIFLELCFENGSEFFASLRFKTNGQPWIEVIKGIDLEENKICWPIPNAEIVNNLLMEQNPDLH